MPNRIRPRLNHATIVAYLALFVALGGSSYSAVKISGKNIKNKSISGKKLKNRTITRGKIKKNTLRGTEINESSLGTLPSASHAATAGTANAAIRANTATTAGIATSANPVAFAHVRTNGTVDTANSKGVAQANVTILSDNQTYCFHGLGFQPRGGQVSLDYGDLTVSNPAVPQFDIGAGGGCAAGTQAFVYLQPGTSFYIVFYR